MINEDECDQDVYMYGDIFQVLDIPTVEANKYCQELSLKDKSHKYDWYYAAGRVVIKKLPSEFKVISK